MKILIILLLTMLYFFPALSQVDTNKEFPVYVDTGKPEQDAERYQQLKKEWIDKNPQAYQDMGGQLQERLPDSENSSDNDLEPIIEVDLSKINIPTETISWEVTETLVIDDSNQLTEAELLAEQNSFKREIADQKMQWKITSDDILYILNDGKITGHFKMSRENNDVKLFQPDDLILSTPIRVFQLKNWTDKQIVIAMPDEDEGGTLVYQLTLTPTF